MNMSAIPFDRETPRISVSGRSRPTIGFSRGGLRNTKAVVGCKPLDSVQSRSLKIQRQSSIS